MYKLVTIVLVALLTGACKDNQKNEKIKEDVQQRMENVGDKIDTTLDKVREGLKEFKDSVKSKIHRATEPDSLP